MCLRVHNLCCYAALVVVNGAAQIYSDELVSPVRNPATQPAVHPPLWVGTSVGLPPCFLELDLQSILLKVSLNPSHICVLAVIAFLAYVLYAAALIACCHPRTYRVAHVPFPLCCPCPSLYAHPSVLSVLSVPLTLVCLSAGGEACTPPPVRL
jgi:hypothetical protein